MMSNLFRTVFSIEKIQWNGQSVNLPVSNDECCSLGGLRCRGISFLNGSHSHGLRAGNEQKKDVLKHAMQFDCATYIILVMNGLECHVQIYCLEEKLTRSNNNYPCSTTHQYI